MREKRDPSPTELFTETTQGLSSLIRDEFALLKSSLSGGAKRLVVAVAILICAIIVTLVSTVVLSLAAVSFLATIGFSEWASGLIVGFGLLFFAVVLVVIALAILKRAQRRIAQPVRNLGRDVQAVKAAYYEQ